MHARFFSSACSRCARSNNNKCTIIIYHSISMRVFSSSMRALRAEQQHKCTIIIYYTISMRVCFCPACAYCARSNTQNTPSLFTTI